MMSEAVHPAVNRALRAANAHDTEAFLDSFTDDGYVDDWGRVFTGREAIKGWSDREFIGVEVTLKVTDVTSAGDTTTVAAQVGGKGFNGPSHFAFTVDGDRVRGMKITG